MNKLFKEINELSTEQKNPASEKIDTMSIEEIVTLINTEDQLVALAVRDEIPHIKTAIENIVKAFESGGRLFYVGAGTSGRLGILDASECPPTFGTDPEMIQGIIAGGNKAVFQAQEGAEDLPENGATEIVERNISPPDIVCGIAASGRTPYVKGALAEATKRGCFTILISSAKRKKAIELGMQANVFICPQTGPELITGSTRMKSGTAQKMVLNMLTTASMVKIGKTLGNVMVDLQMTNEKLKERSKNILMSLTGVEYQEAEEVLRDCNGHVKTALVSIFAGVDASKARELLKSSNGFVRDAIKGKY